MQTRISESVFHSFSCLEQISTTEKTTVFFRAITQNIYSVEAILYSTISKKKLYILINSHLHREMSFLNVLKWSKL